jgi:hypothetical protein
MKGRNDRKYPRTEAAMRRVEQAWKAAEQCRHQATKLVTTDDELGYKDTLIDGETVEVCANKYCGKTLGWPV